MRLLCFNQQVEQNYCVKAHGNVTKDGRGNRILECVVCNHHMNVEERCSSTSTCASSCFVHIGCRQLTESHLLLKYIAFLF
jgi:hypothetical protein